MTTTTLERPASEKQVGFIRDLFEQVQLTDEQLSESNEKLEAGISAGLASRWIDRLLELRDSSPARPKVSSAMPDVPAGRYAIQGEDGTTDFYKVDRPTDGRWKGYTFAKLLVANGGHGIESLSEQRLSYPQTRSVLQKIEAAGVQEAMQAFGRHIGHCGHCGRVLTNEESRELGIGPVCAGKMGWS